MKHCAVLVAGLMTLTLAQAQTTTTAPPVTTATTATTPTANKVDAGSVNRQIEKSLQTDSLPKVAPERGGVVVPEPAQGATSVLLKRFTYSGNSLLSAQQLDEVLKPWVGKPLDFNGLERAAEAVGEAYRRAGWLARATLRRQEVVDGVVGLDILEAKFGGARVEGTTPKLVSVDRLVAMANAGQQVDQPVDMSRLDRSLLLLDDLPGVTVVGNLVVGNQPSQTALVLTTADEPVLSARVSLDNTGSHATGENRLIGSAAFASPFKLGDSANVSALASEGSQYLRLGYGVPIGYNGLRANAWGSAMNYKVVTKDMKASGLKGTSQTVGAGITSSLIRSRMSNLNLNGQIEHRMNVNEISSNTNPVDSDYSVTALQADLSGNRFDSLGGGGVTSASLAYVTGRANLTGSPNFDRDQKAANTNGYYNKLSLTLSRLQTLTDNLSLSATLTAQHANRNLDSSERLYLGGAAAVRAFPSGEGAGSQGQIVSLELRYRATEKLMLSGFYDVGSIRQFVNNLSSQNTVLADRNQYTLQGYGASVAWQGPAGLELKGTLAQRIGSNPLANSYGNDSDGTQRSTRVWVSAAMSW